MALAEVKADSAMHKKTEGVIDFLNSLHTRQLDDKTVKKLLKVQELVREVGKNG